MAVREKLTGIFKTNKNITNNMNFLDKTLKNLYQDTHYAQRSDSDQASDIRNRIDDSINSIIGNNYTNNGLGSISKIFTRMQIDRVQKDKQVVDAMEMFSDQTLTNEILASYSQNKWIRDLDREIDTVLKYCPKLKEALKIKKDCVLSADHFSKEFANFHSSGSTTKDQIVSQRLNELKKIYSLPQLYDKLYDDAQTYGEIFEYIVPYSREMQKLLDRRANTYNFGFTESVIAEHGHFHEAYTDINSNDFNDAVKAISEEDLGEFNLSIRLNKTGVLESVLESYRAADKVIAENTIKSMQELFVENVILEGKKDVGSLDSLAGPLIPSDLELPKDLDDGTIKGAEGIYSDKINASKTKVKVPGCVVKQLDRANVIVIYIEDICLGYYYLEFKNNSGLEFEDPNYMEYTTGINSIMNSGQLNQRNSGLNQGNRDRIINYISKKISDSLDSQFINRNQDLRREIFMILKHNDIFNSRNGINGAINITFLPPEDVVHMYFELDPITKRGVSDVKYSLFPAKLYSCLYITNTLGILTRGQDKRIYYVKQNIDTNISQTMLNVLNQIKKGNFGARQMENLSSILNITGRFNDYIIPQTASGESPVQFDIMEGQKFEYPTELMEKLEELAINPTEIPVEAINARQTLEYAIQATMSNIRVARAVYKRQDVVEYFYSLITSKIYNYEYEEQDEIEMNLPAPTFINMTNGSQLIQGTMQYVQTLADTEMTDATDEEKAEFIKLANRHYLSSHIDLSVVERLRRKAEINVSSRKVPTDDGGGTE